MPLLDPQSVEYKRAVRHHQKSIRGQGHPAGGAIEELTSFRAAEKRYKSRLLTPDLHDVLDLAVPHDGNTTAVDRAWRGRCEAVEVQELLPASASLKDGRAYYLVPRIPGLLRDWL